MNGINPLRILWIYKRNFRGLLFIVMATFFSITCIKGSSSDLEITITPVDTLLSARLVNISLAIENKSDSQIVLYSFRGEIQPAMGGILFFDIIKDGRDTLVCSPAGPIPKYPHENDTTTLSPGEIHEEIINLTSFYRLPDADDHPQWDSTNIWGIREWHPGKYTIRCRYEYKHQESFKGGRSLWRGSAISNTIHIELGE
jgi:hypothetical protein